MLRFISGSDRLECHGQEGKARGETRKHDDNFEHVIWQFVSLKY